MSLYPTGTTEMMANFLVQPLVGLVDTVFDGAEYSIGEELMTASHYDVSPPVAVSVRIELFRINAFVRLGIVAVPLENVPPRSANEDVGQQFLETVVAPFDPTEEVLQAGWVDRDVGLVVLMEQPQLCVDVPGTLVAGCGGNPSRILIASIFSNIC